MICLGVRSVLHKKAINFNSFGLSILTYCMTEEFFSKYYSTHGLYLQQYVELLRLCFRGNPFKNMELHDKG